jgi:hypothetical protein
MTIYASKKSATAAAKRAQAKIESPTTFTVYEVEGGWQWNFNGPDLTPAEVAVETPTISTAELGEALAADDAEHEAAEVADAGAAFEALLVAHGGRQPRGLCKALRAMAQGWTDSRKSFLDGAEAVGLNRANAAAEWQTARQK